jgi:hypothetical protein
MDEKSRDQQRAHLYPLNGYHRLRSIEVRTLVIEQILIRQLTPLVPSPIEWFEVAILAWYF